MSRSIATWLSCGLLGTAPLAQEFTVANPDTSGLVVFGVAGRISGNGEIGGAAIPLGGADLLPVVYDGSGTQFLPLPAGDNAGEVYGMNDLGVFVGSTASSVVPPIGPTLILPRGVAWVSGTAVDLATVVSSGPAIDPKSGVDVNNGGTIVGWGFPTGGGALRGFVLENGVLTELGALPGSSDGSTTPAAIDDAGRVAGTSHDLQGRDHAVLWENGVLTDLHAAPQIQGFTSQAFDMDETGRVVGGAAFPSGTSIESAALWENGQATDLGSMGGFSSLAYGVNNHGDVVGLATTDQGSRAFLWQHGLMRDLNDLIPAGSGWLLLVARDITDDGRIVGEGSFNGQTLPFLLEPACTGFTATYGQGCAGSGGITPTLNGVGCPSPGETLTLSVQGGSGGASGVLAFGTGTSALDLVPGCGAQILPLIPFSLPFVLDGSGPGEGQALIPLDVPPGLPIVDVYAQAAVLDAGAPSLLALTNPLNIHVP